jgi:hypothetical protein
MLDCDTGRIDYQLNWQTSGFDAIIEFGFPDVRL